MTKKSNTYQSKIKNKKAVEHTDPWLTGWWETHLKGLLVHPWGILNWCSRVPPSPRVWIDLCFFSHEWTWENIHDEGYGLNLMRTCSEKHIFCLLKTMMSLWVQTKRSWNKYDSVSSAQSLVWNVYFYPTGWWIPTLEWHISVLLHSSVSGQSFKCFTVIWWCNS